MGTSPKITIAGSGPSVAEYATPVTIATKKRSLPSDYVVCSFCFQVNGWKNNDAKPVIYYRRCRCGNCHDCKMAPHYMDTTRWDAYYKQFQRSKYPPQRVKASLGLKAVFAAIELFNPDEVGLIGFDYILDENTDWEHDAIAEKRCIESLVRIKDLRQDL